MRVHANAGSKLCFSRKEAVDTGVGHRCCLVALGLVGHWPQVRILTQPFREAGTPSLCPGAGAPPLPAGAGFACRWQALL